jgi:hypothetical protein
MPDYETDNRNSGYKTAGNDNERPSFIELGHKNRREDNAQEIHRDFSDYTGSTGGLVITGL